jgi:hypothetical protein
VAVELLGASESESEKHPAKITAENTTAINEAISFFIVIVLTPCFGL